MKYPFIHISHILIVISLLTRLLQTMNDKQILLLLNCFITIKQFVSLNFITIKLFVSFKHKKDAKRNERQDTVIFLP